jgi:hypothetical protein
MHTPARAATKPVAITTISTGEVRVITRRTRLGTTFLRSGTEVDRREQAPAFVGRARSEAREDGHGKLAPRRRHATSDTQTVRHIAPAAQVFSGSNTLMAPSGRVG